MNSIKLKYNLFVGGSDFNLVLKNNKENQNNYKMVYIYENEKKNHIFEGKYFSSYIRHYQNLKDEHNHIKQGIYELCCSQPEHDTQNIIKYTANTNFIP